MLIPRGCPQSADYHYVTLVFENDSINEFESAEAKEFLLKVISSYFSIEATLNKESVFDLLVYNFTTSQFHFMVHVSNKEEIAELVSYINKCYKEWAKSGYNCSVKKNLLIDKTMVKMASAYIHTLSLNWEADRYSSLNSYIHDDVPNWLRCHHIKRLYGSAIDYYEYLKVYNNKKFLVNIKSLVVA